MTDLFDLKIIDRPLDDMFYGKAYTEFCEELYLLEDATPSEQAMWEAVVDSDVEKQKNKSQIVRNTIDTTKSVGRAYGDITDFEGGLIKTSFDLVMKVVHLGTKTLAYVGKAISVIPKSLLSLIDKIGAIPSDVKNKIKGNIKLYITVNDLDMLYNKSMVKKLDDFLVTLQLLTKGEMWGTMFHREVKADKTVGENDMKICARLNSIYKTIENVQFTQTVINMSDERTVGIYFGPDKVINFTDLRGQRHNSTYYEALIQLMDDLNLRKDVLNKLQTDFGAKFSRAEGNQSYAKLSGRDQKQLAITMQQIGKVVTIVGNIVKYVSADIKTMNSAIDSIEKGMNKAVKTNRAASTKVYNR